MATVSVRYIVYDVDAAIAFYTQYLGFTEVMHPAPAFAMLSRGDLRLVLSAPGGWNRCSIEVTDLDSLVGKLHDDGVRFRNDIVNGTGGRQIIAEDPSGNPVELFEPVLPEAKLG